MDWAKVTDVLGRPAPYFQASILWMNLAVDDVEAFRANPLLSHVCSIRGAVDQPEFLSFRVDFAVGCASGAHPGNPETSLGVLHQSVEHKRNLRNP